MAKSSKERGAKRAAKSLAAKHARGARENSAARTGSPEADPEPAAATANSSPEARKRAGTRRSNPLDARELAEEVFAQKDPVTVAVDLLDSGKATKNASVKARVWEKLLEYRFGRPAAMSDGSEDDAPLIVLDLPRPDREYEDA